MITRIVKLEKGVFVLNTRNGHLGLLRLPGKRWTRPSERNQKQKNISVNTFQNEQTAA